MAVPQNSFAPRSRGGTSTGLIVLDRRGDPVSFNAEAFKVLSYRGESQNPVNLTNFLPPKIREAITNASTANGAPLEEEFKSGKRTYRCRVCPLIHKSKDPLKVTTVILIDHQIP
jgi:hypothetical protein